MFNAHRGESQFETELCSLPALPSFTSWLPINVEEAASNCKFINYLIRSRTGYTHTHRQAGTPVALSAAGFTLQSADSGPHLHLAELGKLRWRGALSSLTAFAAVGQRFNLRLVAVAGLKRMQRELGREREAVKQWKTNGKRLNIGYCR